MEKFDGSDNDKNSFEYAVSCAMTGARVGVATVETAKSNQFFGQTDPKQAYKIAIKRVMSNLMLKSVDEGHDVNLVASTMKDVADAMDNSDVTSMAIAAIDDAMKKAGVK